MELTLEQQLNLRIIKDSLEQASREQLLQLCIQLYKQQMNSEHALKGILAAHWGLE